MRVIDDGLLQDFKSAGRCEWCRRYRPTDPHHVFSRGAGRVDARCNLCSLCRDCHTLVHAGAIDQPDLMAIVSQREGCLQEHIVEVIWMIRRLPKDPSPERLALELEGLGLGARVLAERTLSECGVCEALCPRD